MRSLRTGGTGGAHAAYPKETHMAEAHAPSSQPPPGDAADGRAGGAYVYVIAFIAAAGGFNFGFDLVLMSGAILYMEQYFHLSLANAPLAYGFTMTSGKYGALVGVLIGSRLADWLGRKRTLILAAIVLLIGTIGTVVTDSLPVWNVYRILGGVGAGLAALVSPLYISEIAPARQRGM